jgi:hypothetical protein
MRDMRVCRVVPGCPVRATVADHIEPATAEMPDSLFYSMSNLRASCRMHNIARGFAATLGTPGPETAVLPTTAVVTKDFT